MIHEEEYERDGRKFNRKMTISEWIYSAAALGIIRFLEYSDKANNYYVDKMDLFYNIEDLMPNKNIDDEYLADQDYLKFAEHRFAESMHHQKVLKMLDQDNWSPEEIQKINYKLKDNTVMKEVFKGISFDGTNKEQIIKLINKEQLNLVRRIFISSNSGYKKFLNQPSIRDLRKATSWKAQRKKPGKVNRILGFYVDKGKKARAVGYFMNNGTRTREDAIEFDYIPFAFSKGRESIFINNNYAIDYLVKNNNDFDNFLREKTEAGNEWYKLFYNYTEGSDFLKHDVEIIKIRQETEFYETLMLHISAIEVFRAVIDKLGSNQLDSILKRKIKVNDNYYISISEELTKRIINGLLLDDLIEQVLKVEYNSQQGVNHEFLIKQLIKINDIIYKKRRAAEKMEKKIDLKASRAAAKEVVGYFVRQNQQNKIKTYRQKLASTLVAKDYNRFIEIMLQLSSYTEIAFPFMHGLIEDFEYGKNMAYDFVNELVEYKPRNNDNGGNE